MGLLTTVSDSVVNSDRRTFLASTKKNVEVATKLSTSRRRRKRMVIVNWDGICFCGFLMVHF